MSNDSGPDPEMAKKFAEMFEEVIEPYKEILEKQMKDAAAELELGKTGEVPDGQLTERDGGELKLAIAVVDGRVVMNFGQHVSWIGFQPSQARQIAEALVRQAAAAEAWLAELVNFKETQSDG